MQLICESLFPPRMSVTITFLTYSSYTVIHRSPQLFSFQFTYLLHASRD